MSEIDFSEITRDDIIKAFNKYDELQQNNELNTNRKAKDYLLFWNSKEYPHKYVVGIAYGLKYNQKPLDNTLYNSTGNHKASAQWCIEKNGFILYADKKYREYLQKKYDNQTTINTYYSDLKKAIKIFQNIEKLKDKNLNDIFEIMQNGSINFEEYDKAQKELGFNDKQLFNTLKTKAKTYLESLENNEINTIQGSETMDIAVIPNNPNKNEEIKKLEKYGKYEKWGGGLSCIQTVGQLVIFYISGDIKRYCYLAKVTKIDSDGFDVRLLNKFDDSISSLFTREKLTDLGLPIKGPIRYFLNSYPKIYNYVIKILTENNLLDIGEQAYKEIIEEIDMNQTDTIQPLNQILYGPPGTGKTYNTINKAIEIIDNKFYLDNKDKGSARDLFKEEFKKYKEQGQIEFVTFHQSYGYEEFVEGIKAKTNEETKQVEYEIEAGIFKKLCENAKTIKAQTNKLDFDWNRGNIFKMSLGGKSDSEILDWCLDNEYISMGWGNELDFSSITAQSWESFRDKAKSLYQNLDTDRFTLQAMYAFKEWMKKDDLVFVSLGNLKIVAIGQVIGDYEYKESIDEIRYSQFRKVKWLFIDKSGIPVEKLLNKKLSQQTIYNLDKSYVKKDFLDSLFIENGKEELKNYVLIIDEINRGNISKIFGELITLIEDSKRLDKPEQVEITLPYSGKKFGVPSNLYIIGTMNTADRSIAPIDTALRRRFVFEEMAPNPSLLKPIIVKENEEDTKLELAKLLEAINTRIEYLYDRDHTIGHAYLIDVKTLDDLKFAFKNKIIPLLAEYFYEDWENIDLVLNNNGFIESKKDDDKYLSKKIQDRIRNKITYKVSDNSIWTKEHFINIYKKFENEN